MFRVFFCFIVSFLVTGCDGKSSWKGGWQEEVTLNNGQKIWISRTVEYTRNGRDFVTKEGGNITSMAVTIDIPENTIATSPPVWRFDAVPLVLDYDVEQKTWFIIASSFYCSSWRAAFKPETDQWQYVVKHGQWVIVPLDQKFVGRTTNLMIDFGEGKKLKRVTIKDVNNILQHLTEDVYKKIRIKKKNRFC